MQRPQSLYSSPWLGGRWTLRDQVEYMKTASLATLEYAAKYKGSLLYGRYLAGKAQIAKGRTEAPYAYVVPQAQRDPVAAVEMLRRLAFAGVRVSRLTADETIEGERFPEGTWIVPADQEFAALAREVLDVQTYPEIRESPGGPLDQPYDAAGWTLPLSMGVRTVYVQAPLSEEVRRHMKLVADATSEKIKPSPYTTVKNSDAQPFDTAPGIGFDSEPMAKAIVPPAGRIAGSGAALAVNPAENNAFKAINRAWKAGASVRFDRGRYVISGLNDAAQTSLVEALALQAERVAEPAGASRTPRLGLFLANTSMDEGWTRWVLEQYEFQFTRVSGADIQAGSLRDRIDVLVITDEPQGVMLGGGGRGGRAGGGGDQAAANDARAAAIEAFVRDGGTLVCFNRSTAFAIARRHPANLLRRHVAPQRLRRCEPTGHGRDAGARSGVFQQQPRVRTSGRIRRNGTGALSAVRSARFRLPAGRVGARRESRGARGSVRERPRHPAWVSSPVAWPAVRDVQGVLQCAALRHMTIPRRRLALADDLPLCHERRIDRDAEARSSRDLEHAVHAP
jgi:hypothetical protein